MVRVYHSLSTKSVKVAPSGYARWNKAFHWVLIPIKIVMMSFIMILIMIMIIMITVVQTISPTTTLIIILLYIICRMLYVCMYVCVCLDVNERLRQF